MGMYLRSARVELPAAAFVLAGCFKLSREAPPLRHYVLSASSVSEAGAGAVANASVNGVPAPALLRTVTIGLRRMDLASYLSEPWVVTRRGANEVVLSDFHRWGGDVGENINRVVAANLAGSPPVQAVDVAPWSATARHTFLLQLHVTRFEGVADSAATEGRVHVVAGWDIIRPFDGRVLLRGSTDDRSGAWRVGDYTGLVSGLDAALLRMARDISACIARFPNDSTPPTGCAGVGAGDRTP